MLRISQILTIGFVAFLLSFNMYSKKAKRKGSSGKKIGIQRLSNMRKGFTQKKPKTASKANTKAASKKVSKVGNKSVGKLTNKTVRSKKIRAPKNIINGVQQQPKKLKKSQQGNMKN
ncbi:MAG: hypothetical protein GY756_22855 [bacterium]|nr:hypothetical protein [bacterium]